MDWITAFGKLIAAVLGDTCCQTKEKDSCAMQKFIDYKPLFITYKILKTVCLYL